MNISGLRLLVIQRCNAVITSTLKNPHNCAEPYYYTGVGIVYAIGLSRVVAESISGELA
jgi:hypothetical protein|tara:strand:- start:1986 stop:2162 length:177 start_codon:yes stop_codon:yes gene_type:complete